MVDQIKKVGKWFNSVTLRLFLYVSISMMTTLISQSPEENVINWNAKVASMMILNGLIAWRAFIDESPVKLKEE